MSLTLGIYNMQHISSNGRLPPPIATRTTTIEMPVEFAQFQVAYDTFIKSLLTPQPTVVETKPQETHVCPTCHGDIKNDHLSKVAPLYENVGKNLLQFTNYFISGWERSENILLKILEMVERLAPTSFSTDDYVVHFDVLFASNFMKEVLNKLFCYRPTIIPLFGVLTKYCDPMYKDSSDIPLFIYMCKVDDHTFERFVNESILTMSITESYNVLTYFLSHMDTLSDVKVAIKLLDHMKANSKVNLHTLCKHFPEKQHIFASKFFNISDQSIKSCVPQLENELGYCVEQHSSYATEPHRHDTEKNQMIEETITVLLRKLQENSYPFSSIEMNDVFMSSYNCKNIDLFKSLIECDMVNVNMVDEFNNTILMKIIDDSVSFDDKIDYINALIGSEDIDLSLRNDLNQTVMVIYIKKYIDRSGVVVKDSTIKKTSPVDITNYIDCAPYPACFDYLPMYGSCVEEGFSVKSTENEVNIPIVTPSASDLLTEMLEDPTCDPNKDDVNDDSPLFLALQNNDINIIDSIMKSPNFDIDYEYDDGSTPIIRIVKLLCESGKLIQMPMYIYASNKLIEYGASLSKCNLYNKNALLYACDSDNSGTLKILLKCHIDNSELNQLLVALNNDNCPVNKVLINKKIDENNNIARCNRKRWFYFF